MPFGIRFRTPTTPGIWVRLELGFRWGMLTGIWFMVLDQGLTYRKLRRENLAEFLREVGAALCEGWKRLVLLFRYNLGPTTLLFRCNLSLNTLELWGNETREVPRVVGSTSRIPEPHIPTPCPDDIHRPKAVVLFNCRC